MPPLLAGLRGLALLGLPFALAAAQSPLPAIRGTVTDSTRRGPLAGARIVASRTVERDSLNAPAEFTATTDANGRFEISPLAPAEYLVTVERPWPDSTGFDVSARTVDLRDRRSATLQLVVPVSPTGLSASCVALTHAADGRVEGSVRDARSDQPVGGVRVLVAWSDFAVDRRSGRATPEHHTAAARTAGDGSFAVCGLPRAQALLMQAQVGEHATGAVEVEVPGGGVLTETLHIVTNKAGTASVTGDVHRSGSMLPVTGARVHVFGSDDETRSSDDGTFHLNDVPIGTQSIEVTAIGARPRRYAIDVPPDGARGVSIPLAEIPQTLDTVRSLARQAGAPALRDEFDLRAFRGTGQYITEELIAKINPWKTSDLIRYARGFEVRRDTVFGTRGDFEIGRTAVCKPVLLIDGNPADLVDEVLPVAIHGIEIYASSIDVPLKYPASACGAIYIWTK